MVQAAGVGLLEKCRFFSTAVRHQFQPALRKLASAPRDNESKLLKINGLPNLLEWNEDCQSPRRTVHSRSEVGSNPKIEKGKSLRGVGPILGDLFREGARLEGWTYGVGLRHNRLT